MCIYVIRTGVSVRARETTILRMRRSIMLIFDVDNIIVPCNLLTGRNNELGTMKYYLMVSGLGELWRMCTEDAELLVRRRFWTMESRTRFATFSSSGCPGTFVCTTSEASSEFWDRFSPP